MGAPKSGFLEATFLRPVRDFQLKKHPISGAQGQDPLQMYK